ncbi:NAD-dependent epimerase/dehydratase family protein [Geomonas azotofigens]|uniref:NAD-dependent epimerase/dehydratase family protein n=1 Tax=Geomonas azotofigens TaxID=2843196 RepID=UPI001C104A0A|nr:NAD-dependent epimerase/dehydratase family protein [Geomonas azotofigens]MBU5613388.1 NAD-dependent epimerase/dehydratase family protein [Geomonas azotofigens]
MTGSSCLITGGAGFIGCHLVRGLADVGWRVKVLDSFVPEEWAGRDPRAEYVAGNFSDRDLLQKILPGVDVLLHLASTTTPAMAYGRSAYDVETNLIGTLHLLEEALRQGVGRVVFPSSGGTVYGKVLRTPITEKHPTRPISSHGIIKLAIENYIQMLSHEKGLKYTIMRIANPYGPGQRPGASQGAVAVFAGKILNNEPVEIWGDGSVVRDFLYVGDLVQAVLAALRSKESVNQILNIGSGCGVSIRELLSVIEEVTGRRADVRFQPARNFDVPVNILSIKKARAKLGWQPETRLLEGVRDTVPWIEGFLSRR